MDEALDRSPRRLRFTLRGALIAIFFIALILGGIEYIRRESRLVQFAHEQLTLQRDVTEAVLAKARQDLIPSGTLLRSSGTGSSSSYLHWGSQTAFIGSSGRGVIRLEIRGSLSGRELLPIKIIAEEGELNPEIIRRLTKEYDKRKWKYERRDSR